MAVGNVIFVSRNGGMIVVQHDRGYTLAELLGGEGEIEPGDSLRGNWMNLGSEVLHKGSETFDAVVQNIYGSANQAAEAARRMGGG